MNDENSYPKTLILCQNKINEFTGGGVVLSNLFSDALPERLMFFHRDVDYNNKSLYSEKKLDWRWLRFNLLDATELLTRWIMSCIVLFEKPNMKDLKSILIQSCHFHFPGNINQQVQEFKPDVLYAWCSDNLWVKTIRSVAARYNIPYVIHFMDNHVDLIPKTALEHALFPVFKRNLVKVVRKSSALYTISESMGKTYQERWGKPYEVYHGLIETNKWPLPNDLSVSDNCFRLVFTGSIERGQLLGLKDIALALDAFISEGIYVKLVLYLTPAYAHSIKAALGSFRCVDVQPHPDFSALRKELSKADLLVLAFGFDEQTINYYRYSFATKIVPYMMSGRPIFVYGPEEIEPVRYAIDGGWASVVTENTSDLLLNTISELMKNKDKRDSLAKKAWKVGMVEHDLHSNASRFKYSLLKISEMK